MKSRVIFSLLAVLPLLVSARPDLYKEKEDFQYSRTSSDTGNKAGFYESQKGNMGGNYESAYNMDNLAQRQYEDLSLGLGTQVATNLRAGSTFGSASTSGTEYGAAKGSLVGLTGSTNLGLAGSTNLGLAGSNYDSAVAESNYESAANHQTSQASNLNRYSSFQNRNAASSGAVHTGNRYGTNLLAGDRNSGGAIHTGSGYGADVVALDYGLDQGQDQYYDAATGQYVQRSSHGQSSYDTSNSRTVQGNSGLSSLTRPLIVSPVRIQLVPGRPLTVPVSVHSSANRYGTSAQSHTQQVASQANADYDAATNYGSANSYDASLDSQLQSRTGNVAPKRYQSSYSYRKEWERHGAPNVASISPQVTIPIVVPIDNAPASSSLYAETSGGSNSERTQGNLRYSSGSRVASSGRKLDSAQYSNRNSYASGLDTQLAVDSASQINLANSANIRSQNALAAEQQLYGASQLAQASDVVTPKNYQSSYSYHKSWERHGTPYVIKPATLADGSVALNSDLDAAASQQSHQSSSAHSSNAYHSQSSSAALTDASNSRYQTGIGGNLCDSNCYAAYLRDENDKTFRNKRSASNYQHHRSEQDDMHETSDNLDQQLQSFNQEIEDDGQQVTEDFDQKSLHDQIKEGQQVEEFGQANIPAETNIGSSLNVGINYNNPYNYNIKPNDERFSLSFPRPLSNFNMDKDRSIHQQPIGHGFNNHFHHSWDYQAPQNFHTQFGYGQTYDEDVTRINDNIFSEIEKLSKEITDSMESSMHQTSLGVTHSYPSHHQSNYGHLPYHNFNHHAPHLHEFGYDRHAINHHNFEHDRHGNQHKFGHDRHYHEKDLFLHKHSDLDDNCDKHQTVTTIRSMTEDDILRRIHDIQKELNIGQNTFINSNTDTTHSVPKSATDKSPIKPQPLEPNVLYDTREKTPEEIEALSLIRNTTEKNNILRKPENNLVPTKSDDDSKINQLQVVPLKLDSSQESDVGQQTQDFDQQTQDFDQQSQDFGQQIQNTELKPVSLSHKVETFDLKPNTIGYETTRLDKEQKIQGFDINNGNFEQTQEEVHKIVQQNSNITEPKIQNTYQSPDDIELQSPIVDFGQTAIVSKPKFTDQNIDKNSQDDEQSSEDLGQQLQGFDQNTQDFGQQQEDFGQLQEDIGQQQVDIGQQQEIIGQQQVDMEQQQEDIGQQQIDIGQQQEIISQQQVDIEQQIDIGQHVEQQIQVVPQIPEDIDEQTMDIGQQEQSFGQLPKVQESNNIGQLPEYTGQQTTSLDQLPADINQQTQDIGQEKQDFGELPEDEDKKPQDFGQKPEDLGQTPIEIEVYLNQRSFDDNEDVGLRGVSSQLVSQNDQKLKTQNENSIQDDKYKNLEIVETTTEKPGFWKNIGSKLKNTFG